MIRTHIRIAHIAGIRTGSSVDLRQCDWGIRVMVGRRTDRRAAWQEHESTKNWLRPENIVQYQK